MGFLVPAFAAFSVLAGVPLLIHLFGRPRAVRRRFAAIAFLVQSDRKTAPQRRLRELLLMIARAIAIAAVPLALAKPYLETRSDLPGGLGATESAVIVLDDSRSMGAAPDGASWFAAAQERARAIVDGLGRDSEAALVLVSEGAAPAASAGGELSTDRNRIRRAILAAKSTHRAGDTLGALRRAAAILAGAPHSARRVYLVSDLAAHGFPAEWQAPWPAGGPALSPVDVTGGGPRPNRAVVDLRVEPAPALGPRGVRVEAALASSGDEPQKDVPITLRVDGKPVAKGLVDLPAHGRASRSFFHTFTGDEAAESEAERGGARKTEGAGRAHEIAVELPPDALPDDDRRFARVEERRSLRVLLVDGDPRTVRRDDEVFYLETALRPGDRADSNLEVRVTTLDDLLDARAPRGFDAFASWDVIFVCNTKAPSPEQAQALARFVEKGGGLFLSVGDNVDPDAWNAALGDLLPQPLATARTVGATRNARTDGEVRTAGDGERIAPFDRRHPVLAPFAGESAPAAPASLAPGAQASGGHGAAQALREARVARYVLLKPTPHGGGEDHTLLRLDGGAPLLVEGAKGAGRVMLLTTTIDRDWSDLAIQPAYLPLVQQAARYLARAPLSPSDPPILVGQPREIPLAEGDTRLEVTLPSGVVRWFGADRLAGRKTLRFTDTAEPGIYRVATAGPSHDPRPRPAASFAVNVDPLESDLAPLLPERLAALARAGSASSASEPAPRRRVELWHALGAALLALLLAEGLLTLRR